MTKPAISVVVPAYNDAEGIKTTLDSLVNQTNCDLGYEVIVVDNNSSDDTPEVARQFARRYPGLIRVCREEAPGPAAARNRGIASARGEIICFLDADMWVKEDYLSQVAHVFRNPAVVYAGCNVNMMASGGRVERYHQMSHKLGKGKEHVEKTHYFSTAGLMVRKNVFESAGVFDARLNLAGEDKEFGNRVYDAGYPLHYAENIDIYHPASKALTDMLRRYFWYGRSQSQLEYVYPHRYHEFGRRILDPRLYLPPNPLTIKREFPEWAPSTPARSAALYALLYVRKLTFSLGFIYELLVRRVTRKKGRAMLKEEPAPNALQPADIGPYGAPVIDPRQADR